LTLNDSNNTIHSAYCVSGSNCRTSRISLITFSTLIYIHIVSLISCRVRINYQEVRSRVSKCPVNDSVGGMYKERRASHDIP
jgi:hypothetical protein